MNYGKSSTERRIKASGSNSGKYASKIVLTIFKTFFFVCVFSLLLFVGVGFGVFRGIIENTPDVDIDSIVPMGFATTVYDSSGNLTDTLVTAGSNREEATYEELPQDLIDAFVAIEDARFWTHNGIDLRSISRAVMGLISGDYSGGGSTITQQLIKNNVFDGGMENSWGSMIERKLQEQYLALQLTESMDRKLILTNYLNTINLGNNTLGVKVAARRYFDKEVSDLTLSECTVIAGITQNPSKLNPISGKEANEEKRRVILQYMFEQGYITKEEQNEALADDVYERIQNVDLHTKENDSPYSYFTDALISQVKDTLMVQLGYTETQAHNLLYSGGLEIHTTQDPTIQAIVDEEVNNLDNYTTIQYSVDYRLSVTRPDETTQHYSQETLKTWHRQTKNSSHNGLYSTIEEINLDIEEYRAYVLQEGGGEIIGEVIKPLLQPQVSFVIMDQLTGQVKAISGGRGEKTASLTLNRATDTLRQPGSTFKILTAFAPALDAKNSTLASTYYDTIYSVGEKTFKNWYSQGYLGYSTIREGIVYSLNIVAVRAFMETVTPQLGVTYAENFGITSLTSNDTYASLSLGGLEQGVSNLELTSAFATIANDGVHTNPILFTKIVNHDGKILIDNQPETQRVLKESTAFLLTDAMVEVMTGGRKFARSGVSVSPTGTRANPANMTGAGKSGTTTNNVDLWFVGYSPYYTAGIWGGFDSNQHQTSSTGGTSYHKDIWRKIMERVHEGLPDPGFAVPSSITTATVCRKSGKLPIAGVCNADPRGNATYTEYFDISNVPTEVCDVHVTTTVCQITGQLPNATCPTTTSVRMVVPSDDTTVTDDSVFSMPWSTCPEDHTLETPSTTPILPGGVEQVAPGGNSTTPLGPGYVSPSTPTPDVEQVSPVGPGIP